MEYKKYKIKVVNSILDNVHGFVGLTEVENQIEALPIFKRLQNISQLGLSHRIFPCALHNRYIHSLGVLYIVDQMAIKLKIFDDNQRQLLRLAGMLHDIGHYPLSHDIEYVYKKCHGISSNDDYSEKKFLEYRDAAKKAIDDLDDEKLIGDYYLRGLSNESYHHEKIGSKVLQSSSEIKRIIQEEYVDNNDFYATIDNPVDRIIDEISAIITGNAQYSSSLFPDVFSAMIQLMHSELDADRIDYLLRDATFSGASYGSFDLGMLIQSLEIGKYNGTVIVGVNKKGIGCAEQFLINRYLAYNQVINHKYTSIIGCILQAVVTWLIQDPNSGYTYKDIIPLINTHEADGDKRYLYFTDDYIMSFINNLNENNSSIPSDVRVLLRCLKSYRAFDMLSEEIIVNDDNTKIKEDLKRTELYKKMLTYTDSIDKIYQYRDITVTSHVTKEKFDEKLRNTKINEPEEIIKRYTDRLQDGVAVIEDGKEPYLLLDSDRSMLKQIYGIRYSILREYDFEKFK